MIDSITGEIVGPDVRPFVRTKWNYNRDAVSDATGLLCLDPSLAQQNMKEECDINTIVERFGLTGQLPSDLKMPMEGDYTTVTDYQSALNQVLAAEEAFMELPAQVRAKFQNDPQQLLEFVAREENREEAQKLGILVPPASEPSPISVRVVPSDDPGTSST